MKFTLIYLWVTTFLCLRSASALPHRHRGIYYDTKFLNNLNPRSRRTSGAVADGTATAEAAQLRSEASRSTTPSLTKNAPKGKEENPISSSTGVKTNKEKQNIASNARGLLDKTRKPGPEESKKIEKSSNLEDILNYDYDYLSYLYELDFLDLGNETKDPNKKVSVGRTREHVREGRVLNNNVVASQAKAISSNTGTEVIGNLNGRPKSDQKTSKQREKVRRSFRYTTPAPENNHNTAVNISKANDVTLPQSNQKGTIEPTPIADKGDNKGNTNTQNVKDNPTHHASNNPTSDTSANVKPGWTSESSISVEVRIESPHQKRLKVPFQHFAANQAELPEESSSYPKRGRILHDSKNSMQLRERLELDANVTPKITDIKHTSTTTESPRTTNKVTILTTTQSTITTTAPPPVGSTTTTDLASSKTTDIPVSSTTPASFASASTSPNASLLTQTENTTLKSKKLLNTRSSVRRRNNPYTPRRRSRYRTRTGARSIGKGLPYNHLTHSASQLGVNPHGLNPIGISPFGSRPEGISPFGRSPHGFSPLGINATTSAPPMNATSLNETQAQQNTTKPPDDIVKEERYHVQVKKPDGSINGDYVVLNPFTGSLSGVRYEAVDGADQALIQQALLSFLSFDPRLDPRPTPTKTSEAISASATGEIMSASATSDTISASATSDTISISASATGEKGNKPGRMQGNRASRQRRSRGSLHATELNKKSART